MTEFKLNPPTEPIPNLLQHLMIFRRCVIRSLIFVAVIFLGLCYFANELYHLLALPLLAHLTRNSSMIATSITAPLLVPLKFSGVVALFLGVPFILYQLWSFIAPGLYQKERRWAWTMLSLSTLLFYAGVCFAYFVVCPLLFGFMTKIAPEGVNVMPDITQFLDFVLHFFIAFGIAFEVPVLMLLLVKLKITSVESLATKRRYFIVLAFIIGMLLAPPDVMSQTLMAVPLYLLYESGLLAARFLT